MSEKINDADVREGAQHLEHVNSKVDIEDGAVTGEAHAICRSHIDGVGLPANTGRRSCHDVRML
jgi:hypothetical protein